jgi:hypothetical protein
MHLRQDVLESPYSMFELSDGAYRDGSALSVFGNLVDLWALTAMAANHTEMESMSRGGAG